MPLCYFSLNMFGDQLSPRGLTSRAYEKDACNPCFALVLRSTRHLKTHHWLLLGILLKCHLLAHLLHVNLAWCCPYSDRHSSLSRVIDFLNNYALLTRHQNESPGCGNKNPTRCTWFSTQTSTPPQDRKRKKYIYL